MVTKSEIIEALGTYLSEMQRCADTLCNWALAHLVMMMPDICAALESSDGRASETRYRAWCERWLDCAVFNGLERYKLRCSLLHQGQAQPDDSHLKQGEVLRYDRVAFGPSGSPHIVAGGRLLHLDVVKLHADTVRGIVDWAAQTERDQNVYVRPHLADLAKVQPVEVEVPFAPQELPVLPTQNRMIMPGATELPAYVVVTRYVTK